MSFRIERGLFQLSESADYYAILGLPLDADTTQIRKRYLKITRSLHPDGNKTQDQQEKKLASTILSKLVNPAYEQLYKDKSRRSEYQLVLTQIGKRLAAEKPKTKLESEVALGLSKAGANFENIYRSSIDKLSSDQYQSLEQVIPRIAELSELNLVYLMLSNGKGVKKAHQAPQSQAKTLDNKPKASVKQAKSTPKVVQTEPVSPGASYVRRAKSYMEKNNFSKAVLELRDAIKLEPTNSDYHSLIGWAYLQQRQISMARVHLKKSLELNPENEEALKGFKVIEKLTGKSTAKTATTKQKSPSNSAKKSKGNGIFSGLFGGKKGN